MTEIPRWRDIARAAYDEYLSMGDRLADAEAHRDEAEAKVARMESKPCRRCANFEAAAEGYRKQAAELSKAVEELEQRAGDPDDLAYKWVKLMELIHG